MNNVTQLVRKPKFSVILDTDHGSIVEIYNALVHTEGSDEVEPMTVFSIGGSDHLLSAGEALDLAQHLIDAAKEVRDL